MAVVTVARRDGANGDVISDVITQEVHTAAAGGSMDPTSSESIYWPTRPMMPLQ